MVMEGMNEVKISFAFTDQNVILNDISGNGMRIKNWTQQKN